MRIRLTEENFRALVLGKEIKVEQDYIMAVVGTDKTYPGKHTAFIILADIGIDRMQDCIDQLREEMGKDLKW